MKYIIEKGNGNPKIMQRDEDGTYRVIGFGAGAESLGDLMVLVQEANDR